MKQTLPIILALIIATPLIVFTTMHFNVRLEPVNYDDKPVLSAFIDCVRFQASIPAIGDADLDTIIHICMPDEVDDE